MGKTFVEWFNEKYNTEFNFQSDICDYFESNKKAVGKMEKKTFVEWFNEEYDTNFNYQSDIFGYFERTCENKEDVSGYIDNAQDEYNDYLKKIDY